jgi:25S rRNA (cytosine2278-C5)-methyltransferase
LVHDLLLAKRGIALSATHGLRTVVERHKARLQAELTKARIGRKLGSMEALKNYVDSGEEGGAGSEPPHPRWIRINTFKTQLEDQLETTFAEYKRVGDVSAVRQRESRCLYVDVHVPNLIAIPDFVDLTKSEAYTSAAIIFQDKASCFPAYMLDPLPEDGDIIDTCAAPGNKTTHLAAILALHAPEIDDHAQTIHAFEKDKTRAETLKKMVTLADCEGVTKIHAAQDFLKTDPNAPEYQKVGALLLDPSCSGSGIIGRDEMPILHLPSPNSNPAPSTYKSKTKQDRHPTLKRKHTSSSEPLDLVDDNGTITPINSPSDLQTRLAALSAFQLSLLLHAMTFPSAHKITYSTCSIHAAENEAVVTSALASSIAKERGWRILKRDEQVRGMREWPVRGEVEACGGDDAGQAGEEVADACIRANKGDEYGTMGFFLAAFVRDRDVPVDDRAARVMRDEKGFIVRDLMGIPVMAFSEEQDEEEWNGFEEDDCSERVEGEVNSTEPDGIVDIVAGKQADVAGNRGKKRKRKTKKGK